MSEAPGWQKSSFSSTEGDCVELSSVDGTIALRESDEPATVLTTQPSRLAPFLAKVKEGAFGRS